MGCSNSKAVAIANAGSIEDADSIDDVSNQPRLNFLSPPPPVGASYLLNLDSLECRLYENVRDIAAYAEHRHQTTYRGTMFRFVPETPLSCNPKFYHQIMAHSSLEFPRFSLIYKRKYSLRDPVVVDIQLGAKLLGSCLNEGGSSALFLPSVIEDELDHAILVMHADLTARSDFAHIKDFVVHSHLVVALASTNFDPETASKQMWLELLHSFSISPSLTLLYSLVSLWPMEVIGIFV